MTRATLPSRRPAITFDFVVESIHYSVAVGLDPDDAIKEVFIRGAKVDSAVDCVANDVAICMSLLLQHGVGLREISKSTKPGGIVEALIQEIRRHAPELVQ